MDAIAFESSRSVGTRPSAQNHVTLSETPQGPYLNGLTSPHNLALAPTLKPSKWTILVVWITSKFFGKRLGVSEWRLLRFKNRTSSIGFKAGMTRSHKSLTARGKNGYRQS